MVVYAAFNVQLHGLAIKTQAELDALQARIQAVIAREVDTHGRCHSVEVTLDESAGEFN